MENSWIGPKIIIGSTAIGTYYYPRPRIEANIWEEIWKGNYVLLAAPRRVGKSSVMLAMLKNYPEDTRCIFKNIEGIQSEAEFYRQFFELMLECLNKFDRGKNWLAGFFKNITIEEISLDGSVKFGEKKPVDYAKEIADLLPQIGQQQLKIVLLLDELPEVLSKLYRNNRRDEAGSILSHLRHWRQDNPQLQQHFSIVLAGSIGIHHVVKAIEGRTVDINDFNTVPFEALTRTEAADYVTWATQGATVQYDQALLDHLLSKINYFIPYFINLMLDEINKAARKDQHPTISPQDVDTAFDTIVKNSDHFKDWKSRLFDYFSKEEAAFLNNTLIYIAHRQAINQRQLYDLALQHGKKDQYMELMRGLERDGYLTEQGDRFVFVSPFLQAYWKRDNPVFDHE